MSRIKIRLALMAAGSGLACLSAALPHAAWAEPAPAYRELLDALSQSPQATEANALVDAAQARVRQSQSQPNPSLSVSADNAFGTGPYKNFGGSDLNLAVSQNLELWGRRPTRIGIARANASVASARRDLALVETSGRLALAYAEAEAAQQRAALAQEALTLALADARAAIALVEEGREPMLRAIQAESEAASARALLDEANAEKTAAYARLTSLAMLSSQVTSIAVSILNVEASTGALNTGDSPTVKIAEAERFASERRVIGEQKNARPDVTATAGVTRYGLENETAITVGLSVSLPLFDRNRGNIDAARAEQVAAQARVIAARQEATSERQAATARLSASSNRIAAADAGVSAAEEAYRLARIGSEAGRISQLELRTSRAALINARSASVDARMARVRAEIDLARLEGRAPFQGNL